MSTAARDQLALAHERMMPGEIAEHALALADVVESQNEVVLFLLDLITKFETSLDTSDRTRIAAQTAMRQIASLFASNRKKAARDFLRDAAAVEMVRTDRPKVDRTRFVPADVAWPDIFNPKGSKS